MGQLYRLPGATVRPSGGFASVAPHGSDTFLALDPAVWPSKARSLYSQWNLGQHLPFRGGRRRPCRSPARYGAGRDAMEQFGVGVAWKNADEARRAETQRGAPEWALEGQ